MDNEYQEAHRLFLYDEETGAITHRLTRGKATAGMAAGYARKNGYVILNFSGKKFYAHRVIWLMKTGAMPLHTIDHADRDPSNNMWSNLRMANGTQQNGNKGLMKNNKSGARGVRAWRGKWQALIHKNGGAQQYLGCFATKEDAISAYNAAAKDYYGKYFEATSATVGAK